MRKNEKNGIGKHVTLDHGSGGLASAELVREYFVKSFDNHVLSQLGDGAVFLLNGQERGRLAFSTDSYVVDPIFFPGGDIGCLAVHGTLNDLAMCGSVPVCLSIGVILEEGFPLDDLKRISESIAAASISAGVPIVTGDTKVVPKGKADRIFINTAGIGVVPGEIEMTPSAVRAGDAIILSGSVGDHGVTILASREGMEIPDGIRSDTAPLHHLTKGLLEKFPGDVRIMRDPTRGGVATVLCEIAEASAVTLVIEEEKISVKRGVKVVCDLLGLDPLYLANEGKCIIFTDRSKAKEIVDFIRREPVGKDAEIIGHVESGHPGRVVLKTGVGGERLLRALSGEPLPRIC